MPRKFSKPVMIMYAFGTGLAWYVRRGVETGGINPDHVYGELARSLLPGVAPGFLGLFIAAMLASVMSSCSADMISSSALFTENLYRPMVPGRSSAHYIGASRVASVLIVAGGSASRTGSRASSRGWRSGCRSPP